jgi:hypothetical protein
MRRVLALWTLNGDIVDERAVRIKIVDVPPGARRQLLERSNGREVSSFASPNR